MNRRVMNAKFAPCALALALAVTACGSDANSHPPTASPPEASPPAAAPSVGPGDVPVMKTVRRGQPFHLSYPYADGGSAAWKVTLDKITCGGPEIFSQ